VLHLLLLHVVTTPEQIAVQIFTYFDFVSYVAIVFSKVHFSAREKVGSRVCVQGSKCVIGKAGQLVRCWSGNV